MRLLLSFILTVIALQPALGATPGEQCQTLFEQSYKTRGETEVKETVKVCAAAAKRQDPLGLFYIGRLYHAGLGFEKDAEKGAKWINAAAQLKLPRAASFLGRLYMKGDGVKKDEEQAARLFYQAAQGGDGLGQYEMAMRYYQGTGIKQNTLEAYKWFTQAIDSNSAEGNESLVKLASRKRINTEQQLSEPEKRAAAAWLQQYQAQVGHKVESVSPSGVATPQTQ